MNFIKNILSRAALKPRDNLNIITCPTHEAYESNLARTPNCNFYAVRGEGIKDWNTKYRELPPNYVLLDKRFGDNQIPDFIDFHCVLSQNKWGQYPVLSDFARKSGLPLITLEHTLPMPDWSADNLRQLKQMTGNINVFISEYSIKRWGWEDAKNVRVVHHCVDHDLFKPAEVERHNVILSVVNDWVNRDWCCNFQGWVRTTESLPVHVLGDTPNLSNAAASIDELVETYQKCRIFYNTSTISPIPTALLEAMSSGCACVSTATCMIPEIIEHGVNGFISNDEKELRGYLELLLSDDVLAKQLGEKARETILSKFSKQAFVRNWRSIFKEVSKI